MGLETATYISGLNAANPTSGDPKSEGDNHIRLLKSTLLATFPSITAAVTATHAELNLLDGVTATTAELNTLDGVTATAAEINKLDGVTATTTELNYVDGVTSNIQAQFDLKAPLASPTLTGNPTAPTQTTGDSTTKLATTSFVAAAVTAGTVPASYENLFINSNFAVNQEGYTSGVITTGSYGHDMMKSISSASYTVSGGALTMVSGTLGQKNDDLVAANGETLYISVKSGSLTVGASGGAAATTITPSTPYSFTYSSSTGSGFITITDATAAKGIRIGRALAQYAEPEPRAEEARCYYYYQYLSIGALPVVSDGTSWHGVLPLKGNLVSGASVSYANLSVFGALSYSVTGVNLSENDAASAKIDIQTSNTVSSGTAGLLSSLGDTEYIELDARP